MMNNYERLPLEGKLAFSKKMTDEVLQQKR